MIFREITVGSTDFPEENRLRNEVLRAPLGLSLTDEDLAAEKGQMHFGLFTPQGELLACVMAAPISLTEAKVRQMAVAPDHQGMGCGSKLIRSLEEELVRRGFRHLWLHARLPAVPFYQKTGYRLTGDEFIEVGLSHVRMEKAVGSSAPASQIP